MALSQKCSLLYESFYAKKGPRVDSRAEGMPILQSRLCDYGPYRITPEFEEKKYPLQVLLLPANDTGGDFTNSCAPSRVDDHFSDVDAVLGPLEFRKPHRNIITPACTTLNWEPYSRPSKGSGPEFTWILCEFQSF